MASPLTDLSKLSTFQDFLDRRLDRAFYARNAVSVARALLGQCLVRRDGEQLTAGVIVETEAYVGIHDKAAHAYGGRRTARNESMYAQAGTAYVFLNYGIHHLFNVVVAEPDDPQAVLVRAVEPTHGISSMQQRRLPARTIRDLCAGPGKLGAAFAIDLRQNGIDLVSNDSLFIARLRQRTLPTRCISTAPRIGVEYAHEWADAPLRFFVTNNPHVSVR